MIPLVFGALRLTDFAVPLLSPKFDNGSRGIAWEGSIVR